MRTVNEQTPQPVDEAGCGAKESTTPRHLVRHALPVKRQPAGLWSENRPDADGIWRRPAPLRMPCKTCGELTTLLSWCAKCRSWTAFLEAKEAGDRESAAYHLGMFRRSGGVL